MTDCVTCATCWKWGTRHQAVIFKSQHGGVGEEVFENQCVLDKGWYLFERFCEHSVFILFYKIALIAPSLQLIRSDRLLDVKLLGSEMSKLRLVDRKPKFWPLMFGPNLVDRCPFLGCQVLPYLCQFVLLTAD